MSDPFAVDFDCLEGGERFVTRGRTITEADIVGFATLSGDMHPQHTDASWAASSASSEQAVCDAVLGPRPIHSSSS